MNLKKSFWMENLGKVLKPQILLILLLALLVSVSFVSAVPVAPSITYRTNTTFTSGTTSRANDTKGTITTLVMTANQQDYRWKAYVGNVSGTMFLADSNGVAIYNWPSGTPTGEVYVSRFNDLTWTNMVCVNPASIVTEETVMGMVGTQKDSINGTFSAVNHLPFLVGGTVTITGCRSTATFVNGASQTMGPTANFQEILIRDSVTGHMAYSTLINATTQGYNGQFYDFQMIVAEDEGSGSPTPYYFWVELG